MISSKLVEFSQKYFQFKNNWHHLLFYHLLDNKVFQGKDGMFHNTEEARVKRKHGYKTGERINNRHFLILSPRFSAKSSVFSFVYPLYEICRNPNVRILVVSANEEIATSFVRQVMWQLENNEALLKDFGYLIPTRFKKWGEKAFIVKRDTIEKDPTMSAAGLLGKIVSKRADIIILDDIIDLESARTNTARNKVLEWFDNVLYPILEPQTGRILVVGTRWFKGDLYDTLWNEREFDVKLELKAFVSNTYERSKILKSKFTYKNQPLSLVIPKLLSRGLVRLYRDFGLKKSLEEGVLWADKWSLEQLLKTKEKIGDTAFSRQFLNEPTSPIDTFFSKSSIDEAYKKGRGYNLPTGFPEVGFPSDMILAMGVDLALSTSKTSDYTAISVWGLDDKKVRYLLYLEKIRAPIDQVKQRIVDLYYLFKPLKVIVESNVFQELVSQELSQEIDVEGIKTTAISKFDEARGLGHMQILFDQGKIVIPNRASIDAKKEIKVGDKTIFAKKRVQDVTDFYKELLQVRLDEKSHTPDTVMASWFALSFLKNYDELISSTAGYFPLDFISFQMKKVILPSQFTFSPTKKIFFSYNSIFYSFVGKEFFRKSFIFATAYQSRIVALFFDFEDGELIAKIDGAITPTFFAEWITKRAALFSNSPIAVYKDFEGETLLYELQRNNYPSLYVSYPRPEDGLPLYGIGVPPLPYILSPAFEFVKFRKKEVHIKDKQILLEFSRILMVSGKEILTSRQSELPQRALTFALGYYLWYHYNREEKRKKEGSGVDKRQEKEERIKFKPPHYTIFNYS